MNVLRSLLLAVCGLVVGVGVAPARAQSPYSVRPVEMIVPWGAGGGADVLGRILARWLEADLKTPVPVQNLPGASGMIGLGRLVNQPADGQTLAVLTGDSLMMAATGAQNFKFTDTAALAVLVRQPSGVFVPANSRFKTWQDVVKASEDKPGSVSIAITGPNTADDLTVRYLASKSVLFTGVPYTKPAERYAAVMGGHVEMLYEQAGDVRGFLDAGQMRPLIFFADKRLSAPFADVPASAEFGYQVTLPQVRAVLVKAGTDPKLMQALEGSIDRFTRSAEYVKFLEQQMAQPDSFMPLSQAQPFLLSELESMRKLLAAYRAN
jgi:tripartite-type tricarboxylate transporter receptor subunit TctC